MDFAISEDQRAVTELAAQIFADHVTHDRLKELGASGDLFDSELWSQLSGASLLGLALPEKVGGMGLGLFEICLLLEQQGRFLAPVPLLPTLVLGGLPITEFGSSEQQERLLAPVASEGGILSAGLEEAGLTDPARTRVVAERDGEAWRLDGEKLCVPVADRALRILIPARSADDALTVFLLDPSSSGVSLDRQQTTNGEPLFRVALAGARVAREDVLGTPGAGGAIVHWLEERALTALAALQLGVAEEALRRTAEYTTERKQFGRPIGSFQGVSLRVADAYIDVEAMRSTLWRAIWKVSTHGSAPLEVLAAKWWACRGGHRVAHSAQHLHGGIGADIDYPIHRYMLWSRQIELTLGGASQQLSKIGAHLAEEGTPWE